MKKLLTLFSILPTLPMLGQLTISCENSEKKELAQIFKSIKSLNITDINETELKNWCLDWIKYIEKENQPQKLTNAKLKDIILTNLAIYSVAHFIDEEEKVKNVIKQINKNGNLDLEVAFSALQEISEEKIVKTLIYVLLILQTEEKPSAFKCAFESQTEESKRFVLKVEKANWKDIAEETNQAFIKGKKMIVEKPVTELTNDPNLPLALKQKAEKVQSLIKHVKWDDVKNVYDNIINEKTFTIDFTN